MEIRTDSDDATKEWLIIQRPRSPRDFSPDHQLPILQAKTANIKGQQQWIEPSPVEVRSASVARNLHSVTGGVSSGRTAKGQRKRQRGGCRLGAADVAADDADADGDDDDDDDDDAAAVARWSGPSGEEAKGEKMPEGETSQPREHAKSHARRQ
ncbi:uncharacterized protein PADG_08496 [Paracoccidioides brasiliensis Pb18]|uniref:Uncharacterized protein n=1 Tax=Paracoccidioides brasiliensis (strain Pb18) TaxID=502780 RepID=C1GML0_PARBD|nr:uncharacterized protein PADG_08496 [Paracoccidioides brasiliensis Pb18]EEH43676.2 hypothetical protein PADG_08496 [Paracoccidioides brasiliensis Pb18]